MSDILPIDDQRQLVRREDDETLAYLAGIVASCDDAIIGESLDGTIMALNAAAEELYGYGADEIVGRHLSLIVPPDGRGELSDLLERVRRGERIEHHWVQRVRKDGTMLIVSLSVSPVLDAEGRIVGTATISRDVTTRARTEDQVQAASLYARSLIEASLDPLMTITPEGKIADANEATTQVTGFQREALIGTDFSDYFTQPEKARACYREVLRRGQVRDYPLSLRHVSGSVTDVEYNATVFRNETGELQGVFAAARDVTERRALEDKLRKMSLRDAMTGLYNRRGFALLAGQRLEESRRSGSTLTIIYADVDHLKAINDAHGHNAGDLALSLCAQTLEATFRKSDIVARIGGDEFVALTQADGASVATLAKRLEDELDRQTAASDLGFPIALTIGSAYSKPPHALSLDGLLEQADAYMYEHKHRTALESE